MRRPRRTDAARALDGVLVLVAALGAIVLLTRLVGAVLGLDLVMFATGSMSPAYPQGAVAIAQRTPLADVRVGDVVTIDRPGELPITHRVVSVRADGVGDAQLRLKGDANRDPDPDPYLVDHVSRVVMPLPVWLWSLKLLGSPVVSITAALVAALAVGWALWPRRASASVLAAG